MKRIILGRAVFSVENGDDDTEIKMAEHMRIGLYVFRHF